MTVIRLVGIVLFGLGLVALAFGGFRWTETRDTELGPLEIQMQDEERFPVPLWASVSAIVGGGVLIAWGGRRRL